MKRKQLGVLIMIAIVLLLPSSAMASTPEASPSASGPYTERFQELRLETSNPQILAILSDDAIDALEYELLKAEFKSCMHNLGYDVQLTPEPDIPGTVNFEWSIPDAPPGATPVAYEVAFDAYDRAFGECIMEWGPAMALFSNLLVNPDNNDIFELNLACLHRYQLVPEDFGRDDIDRAAEMGDWGPGVDPSSHSFTICLVNPLQIGLEPMADPAEQASPAAIS